MSAARIESEGGGAALRLNGPLVAAELNGLLDAAASLLRGGGDDIVVDLAGVSTADSAGIALLVDWLACARGAGKRLRYTSPPAVVVDIARVSGVDKILRLDET